MLSGTPRNKEPLDWATTQNNLGNVLWTLGGREPGTARLEEAVVAYRAALGEQTRDRVPLDWAMTQNNLAIVLKVLGEHGGDEAMLVRAANACEAALDDRPEIRAARGRPPPNPPRPAPT